LNDILNKPGFWRFLSYVGIGALTVVNLWVLHSISEVATDLKLQPGFILDRNLYKGFIGVEGMFQGQLNLR
jgi:hypothetical protein